jgi:hypothetical protein
MTPRFVAENRAAEQLGIPLSTFRRLVEAGHLPGPNRLVGLYDTRLLDAACDRLSGVSGSQNALDAWLGAKGEKHGSRQSEGGS